MPLHFCQRDTWYENFLNGILGVKWTHEGALMDVWTDTSGKVSNDEITLSQTTYKDKKMFLPLVAAAIVQLGH